MTPEKSNYLFNKYPHLFRGRHQPLTQNLMGFGFECADGWVALIDNLCEAIQVELEKNSGEDWAHDFIVTQVKEKYGGLRFYTGAANDVIFDLIDQAEQKSYNICEVCGEPGDLWDMGWVYTRCMACFKELVND